MHPSKTDNPLMPKAVYFLAILLASVTFVPTAAHAGLFGNQLMVNGAGATFPYPLYSKWFAEYQKLHPGIAINYQAIGSGGGIRQLLDETVDFGASDVPMTDEQLKQAPRSVVHIPATSGAIVMTYNLPPLKSPIKLTGAIIADIYQKKITKWTDPRLLELNPELKTLFAQGSDANGSNADILVVHRADGSGTSAVFTEYLSKVSESWKKEVGHGTALRWPTGIGGKGNDGVTSFVKQIPGSIGFVELVFAKTLKLPYALLENSRHEWVDASMESVTAAAEGALKDMPEDFRTSIIQRNAPNAYPISSFTYLLIPAKAPADDHGQYRAILDFMKWGLTEGQKLSPALFYAPLPKALVDRILKRVNQLEGTK